MSDFQKLKSETKGSSVIDSCIDHLTIKKTQENAPILTAPSIESPQYLIPVPSPQLKAAINAIENTVQQMYNIKVLSGKTMISKEESGSNEMNGNDDIAIDESSNDFDSNSSETMRSLFNQLQLSVVDQILNLVKPVTWKEYDESYIQFDTPLRRKLPRKRNVDEEDILSLSSSSNSISSSSSSSSCSDDDEEDDKAKEEEDLVNSQEESLNDEIRPFSLMEMVEEEDADGEEEEDLLDLDAVSRVKDLRNQVRKAAEQTCSIRYKQMERLDSFIQKELQLWNTNLPEECKENKIEGENTVLKEIGETGSNKKDLELLDNMQSSIMNLLQAVRTLDVKLPEQLDLLSETLGTLDHSLKRKERVEGAENVILSGTEKAIISRVETKRKKSKIYENKKKMKFDGKKIPLKPERRFALFMTNE